MRFTQSYKGYVISFDEPPVANDNWSFEVASDDPLAMARIKHYIGAEGAHVIQATSKENGLAASKAFVDRVV